MGLSIRMLLAPFRLPAQMATPRTSTLHCLDILLLINYITSTDSIRVSTSFSPVCLPKYSEEVPAGLALDGSVVTTRGGAVGQCWMRSLALSRGVLVWRGTWVQLFPLSVPSVPVRVLTPASQLSPSQIHLRLARSTGRGFAMNQTTPLQTLACSSNQRNVQIRMDRESKQHPAKIRFPAQFPSPIHRAWCMFMWTFSPTSWS